MTTTSLLDRLAQRLGHNHVLTDYDLMAPYLAEERGNYASRALAILRPKDTFDVAASVKECAEAGVAIVPQGGNTGLVGGTVSTQNQIILSLSRLNRVRGINPANRAMTVEAGCILSQIQSAADEQGLLFPLSMASEGSCQIGGNLATNAGGTSVLRYGNARDLVLGLEVVLSDGTVWNGLKGLRKDNTGYDLKQLFIGSEGTLGIITAATLKLFAKHHETVTAFLGLASPQAALDLLARLQDASGEQVTAFELMSRNSLEFVTGRIPGTSDPLSKPYPWYVLAEIATSRRDGAMAELMEGELARAIDMGLAVDGTLAVSLAQRQALWKLRESIPEAQKPEGASLKHDISVPVSCIPDFLERAINAATSLIPGIRPCPFGHVGDGNLHFNLSQPKDLSKADFLAARGQMAEAIHDIAASLGGSFSAEHGVGLLKLPDMMRYKQPVERDIMRRLKTALDPITLLNPGKVVE
ncbi:MAG: FAD-binding oxidoreductase [Alphaproteobacteria bacterium]|nr:FAD-binding oxidoreductase [Alphaproteobacteria bacterium]